MCKLDIFHTLHHVCIVVRDLDKSVAYYESIGIGPWHDFPSLSPFLTELSPAERDDYLKLRYRYANLPNVQIQLCAPPVGDTPQRQFLETRGEGVYHMGFTVPDCDAAEAQGVAAGMAIRARGRKPDGSGFTYFETADRGAGVILEVRMAR